MIKNINPRNESIININDNKIITTSSLSNKIKKTNNIDSCIPDNNRLSNLHYQKKHFAISTCHFEPSEQKEINLIKYSPPVERITLPYKYHEAIEVNDHFLILKSPRVFNHSVSIKNQPLINEKQDAKLMLIDKTSTPETNFFKEFNLKRSSSRFSNLILEIKSTHEKGIRYLKNIFKKNKSEQFLVTFKKEIETQKKHEITKENNVITYQNTASTQKVEDNLNTLKSLKANLAEQLKKTETDKENAIKADEERIKKEAESSMIQKTSILKINDENKIKSNNNEFEFNDELEWDNDTSDWSHNLYKKINGSLVRLSTPSTHQLNKLLVDETDMKSINRHLKNMDTLNELENKIHSSNESLNSNSSGYFSEKTDESGYSSEETAKIHVKNDHIATQKNKKLKNKETENTETPHKKTRIVVKPKKKTYQFNGKINQTRTSMLRAKHNSEKYQFSSNENSSKIASNKGKPNTKNLDAMLDKTEKTMNEINNLSKQIAKEEAHSAIIQAKLAKLNNK